MMVRGYCRCIIQQFAHMEDDLLRWFRHKIPSHPQMVVGPGDDAAVLKLSDGAQLVATTDMLMVGTDFELDKHSLALIGHKALAVNLSDLAAMAAKPIAALISLALPASGGEALAKQLYEGILATAERFGVAIAGGDTNSWNGPLVISVTALGEVMPGREWRRSGAKPGDVILVTGAFGGSILGRHLEVAPRVNEALWLAEHAEINAAMDVSDGLSLDLARLAEASGVGACIALEQVPIAEAAHTLAAQLNDGCTALEHALGDGEDFELILAVEPESARKLLANPQSPVSLSRIGHIQAGSGLWHVEGGKQVPLIPRGYQHSFKP